MFRTALLALVLSSGVASAATPTSISHQARLTDTLGSPINSPVTIVFSIHEDATSTGTPLWSETWTNVTPANGYVSVSLGSVTPFPDDLFSSGTRYLATRIGTIEIGARTPILAVPVAITSQRAERGSAPPVACDDPSHYGRMYFDTVDNRFKGCDDRGWGSLGGGSGAQVPIGGEGSLDEPGRTCLDIHEANPSFGDGLYWIDPDGDGDLVQVQCDMTRAGGGWTLGLKNWYQSGIHGNTGAVGSVVDGLTLKGNTYKLSDEDIRAIIGEDHRFDVLGDQNGYQSGVSTGNHEFAVLENYTGGWRFDALVSPSRTPTRLTSYRASDEAVAWEGALECGNPSYITTAARGIHCYYTLKGVNPYGGPHCDINMGLSNGYTVDRFGMSDSNSDTYLYLCNGTQHSSSYNMNHRWWFRERPIERTSNIGTTTNPGDSCKDILTQDPTAESGQYAIRPGGSGPITMVQCDMETQGGGWTLGLKVYHGNPAFGQGGAAGDINNALTIRDQPYKLADADINAVIGNGTSPYDMLVTGQGYNSQYSIGNLEYITIENFTGAFSYTTLMPDSTTTTPVFTSWRLRDDAMMWTGRLRCGSSSSNVSGSGRGLNCYDVASGGNPAGGAGCSPKAWPNNITNDPSWHTLFMSEHNADTYVYVCNGAQHSSGHVLSHLWWFRESD